MPPSSVPSDKMYRALRHQLDAEYADARKLYTEALAETGQHPDAMNMLGLVEWHLGNTDRAMELITEAVRLAPGNPAIRANQNFIVHAHALRKFRPLIFDPDCDAHLVDARQKPLLHICEVAGDPSGGTEHRAIELANRLRSDAEVVLWTQNRQLPSAFTARQEIRVIDESRGVHPQGGTLFICGSYIRVGAWFNRTSFRRVVVLCNVVDPMGLSALLAQVCVPGKAKVELIFASEWLRSVMALPGRFEPSPIDTDLFAPGLPATAPSSSSSIAPLDHELPLAMAGASSEPSRFIVGRLSREDPVKFHPDAPAFFTALASRGATVRLMGGTPLLPALRGSSAVEVLRQNAMPAADFLRSLDCFTYRTNPSWTEAWGRVVTEAMSVGLPVVAHAAGGYAQIIDHGENGFLFHRDAQALELIAQLRGSPDLCKRIGSNARQTILSLCAADAFKRFSRFYLQ